MSYRRARSDDRDPRIVCAGEVAWDLVSLEGAPLEEAPALRPTPGGGAANTALELARLGVQTSLCAAVGDDPLGLAMRRRLEAGGVDTSLLVASPLVRTGLVLIGSPGHDGRRFMSYRAPDDEARALRAELPDRLRARFLHLSALVPSRAQIALFRAAIRRARRGGASVTLDLNARPRLWRRSSDASDAIGATDAISEILRAADWIKCSDGDLEAMRASTADLRARIHASAVLIVTSGAGPVRAFGPFGSIERAPDPISGADPAGSGDAFCAGLLAELMTRVPASALPDRAPVSEELAARCIDRGIDVARAHLERRRASLG
jgi:sugar/nucleoside kinase (ribokinase family)